MMQRKFLALANLKFYLYNQQTPSYVKDLSLLSVEHCVKVLG